MHVTVITPELVLKICHELAASSGVVLIMEDTQLDQGCIILFL